VLEPPLVLEPSAEDELLVELELLLVLSVPVVVAPVVSAGLGHEGWSAQSPQVHGSSSGSQ